MRFSTQATTGGLGDDIALTALIRAYKKAHPEEIIRPASPRQEELFRHNPHVGTGTQETKKVWLLSPMANENIGNLPTSYAKQVGVTITDTTPEVFLTADERFDGVMRSCSETMPYKRPLIVAMDPWATWPSRRWPFENYVALTRRLQAQGALVVELGKPVRDEEGKLPEDRLPADVQLFDKLKIRETAAVIAACDLIVCNDSGLFHLAAAVGTPQAVFFSVKPWYARAYWNTIPLHASRRCGGTCKWSCGIGNFCLKDVPVDAAVDAVGVVLARYGRFNGRLPQYRP